MTTFARRMSSPSLRSKKGALLLSTRRWDAVCPRSLLPWGAGPSAGNGKGLVGDQAHGIGARSVESAACSHDLGNRIPRSGRGQSIELAGRIVRLVRPADPDQLLDDPLVIDWNRHDDYMPYWAYLWPAAYLLAEAVAREPWPEQRRVLPPGAGDRLRTGSGRAGRRGARPASAVHRLRPGCPGFRRAKRGRKWI